MPRTARCGGMLAEMRHARCLRCLQKFYKYRTAPPLRPFPPRGPWPLPPRLPALARPRQRTLEAARRRGHPSSTFRRFRSCPSAGTGARERCTPPDPVVEQAQAFVDRRERRASRRAVRRTGERDRQRGFSTSLRWTGRKPDRPGGPDGCGSIFAKLPVFTADFTVKRRPALRSRPQSPCRTVRPTMVRTPPSMLQRARFMRWLTRTLLADDAGARSRWP